MITDAKAAKQISDLMWEILRKIEESLDAVKQTCSPEQFTAYHRVVGEIVRPIMFQVLEPLYNDNPALKPAGWDK